VITLTPQWRDAKKYEKNLEAFIGSSSVRHKTASAEFKEKIAQSRDQVKNKDVDKEGAPSNYR
jgi:hypothetical protein